MLLLSEVFLLNNSDLKKIPKLTAALKMIEMSFRKTTRKQIKYLEEKNFRNSQLSKYKFKCTSSIQKIRIFQPYDLEKTAQYSSHLRIWVLG